MRRRQIRDNVDIPIDRIRFLANEQVQEELELTEGTRESLQPLTRALKQFEHHDKWDFFSKVEGVSFDAKLSVRDFIEEINALEEEGTLTTSQISRIDQLRLRFNCLGVESDDRIVSPTKNVLQILNLTNAQTESIRTIIKEELGDLAQVEPQYELIKEVLTGDQRQKVDAIFGPYYKLNTPKGLLLAHCQELFHLKDLEKDFSSDFGLELLEGVVLTSSGRMVIESMYLEGGPGVMGAAQPWTRILKQSLHGGLDWLELTAEQRSELESLRIVETMDDGGRRISYFGMHVFSKIQPPADDWSRKRNLDWQRQWVSAKREADELLGNEMQKILLPNQIELLGTGLAAQRTQELGPYHILISNLADALKITDEQKDKIANLREDRLSKLESVFSKIDRRANGELTKTQQELFGIQFGDHCSIYPSIWLFLVD